MDISKLPKMSKTVENQPPADDAGSSPPAMSPGYRAVSEEEYRRLKAVEIGFAEAWISIGLGLILLFVFPNTIKYTFSPAAFQQDHPVVDPQGNTIPYLQTVIFLGDLGITVFAGALIIEGIVLAAARKAGPLYFAFALTVLAAIFNVFATWRYYSILGELPIVCAVGVVVLGYMAMTQWRLITALRR
jgi:hypothetical protein